MRTRARYSNRELTCALGEGAEDSWGTLAPRDDNRIEEAGSRAGKFACGLSRVSIVAFAREKSSIDEVFKSMTLSPPRAGDRGSSEINKLSNCNPRSAF